MGRRPWSHLRPSTPLGASRRERTRALKPKTQNAATAQPRRPVFHLREGGGFGGITAARWRCCGVGAAEEGQIISKKTFDAVGNRLEGENLAHSNILTSHEHIH